MNIGYGIALAIAIALIAYGVFKEPAREPLPVIKARIKSRKEYLPKLRNIIDQRLKRQRELATKAGKLPLEEYYNRYLSRGNDYKLAYRLLSVSHKEPTRRKMAIITGLHFQKFFMNNVYLFALEENDDTAKALRKEYDTYSARNTDSKLSREIETLLKVARQFNSCVVLAEIGKHSDLPFKSSKYIAGLYSGQLKLDRRLQKQHQKVNGRFAELLDEGVPDE